MGVIFNGQPKWPGAVASGISTTYSPGPSSLMMMRERSGKRLLVDCGLYQEWELKDQKLAIPRTA